MSVAFRIKASRGAFDLDFAFAGAARVVAVEGPSGAGKTTLLKGLAGLIPVQSARLEIDGRPVIDTEADLSPAPHRRRIGFVFQDARLFPHLTVADNVAFGRPYADSPMAVADALALVGLEDFGDRWPRSLSGGEMRRVAIARALCTAPQILFLDEPFSGLDAARRADLTPWLIRLRDETGLPMLLVSHDPRDIEALAQDSVHIRSGRRE
jgi:molybdate transport system ATP-binding protein